MVICYNSSRKRKQILILGVGSHQNECGSGSEIGQLAEAGRTQQGGRKSLDCLVQTAGRNTGANNPPGSEGAGSAEEKT